MLSVRKSILYLLGAQLVLVGAAYAEETRGGDDKHHKDKQDCCFNKNVDYTGKLYRGYGPNQAGTSGALAACPLFDDEGHRVGFTATFPFGADAVRHEWNFDCGSLQITVKNGVTYVQPVDEVVVSSFQQLAPYLNNPNAALLTFVSDHFKDGDASVIDWQATGSLKKANRVEFRCVYLTLFGNISQCLGCHWFIGRE